MIVFWIQIIKPNINISRLFFFFSFSFFLFFVYAWCLCLLLENFSLKLTMIIVFFTNRSMFYKFRVSNILLPLSPHFCIFLQLRHALCLATSQFHWHFLWQNLVWNWLHQPGSGSLHMPKLQVGVSSYQKKKKKKKKKKILWNELVL